jgi:hypothetical protein
MCVLDMGLTCVLYVCFCVRDWGGGLGGGAGLTAQGHDDVKSFDRTKQAKSTFCRALMYIHVLAIGH